MTSFSQIQFLIHTFNWHSPSWDLFILLFWIVASVLFAFSAGRGRMLTILVSTYMAQLLVIKAPFFSKLVGERLHVAAGTASLSQLGAFVILFLVFFIFLNRYAFKTSVDGRQIYTLPFALVFSILQVGLLINVIMSYIPDYIQNSLSPLIQFLFLSPNAGFIWLLLPVVFLIFTGRFLADNSDS
jgi:hypothetical protein